MDGLTLNPKYNDLLKFWQSVGEPMEPECDLCGQNLENKKVVETLHGFLCTHCDDEHSGQPILIKKAVWPTKGLSR